MSTFWQNLKKILGAVFSQFPKNLQIKSNLPIFNTNERFSRKRDFFSKKRPCYVSCIFCPQLHTKFRKNPRSGFWDMLWRTDGQTNGQTNKPEFIDPPVFNRGPKNGISATTIVIKKNTTPYPAFIQYRIGKGMVY